jgi:hypothetical protein
MSYMKDLFPRDRFLSMDLIAIANSSSVDYTDNEFEIELNLGQGSSLSLCFPGPNSNDHKIPTQLLEILSQFNQIDNSVQSFCENLANNSSISLNNHQFFPSIIYLESDGTIFIDYWGTSVNNQWSVYLGKLNDQWLAFKDENLVHSL